MVDQNTASTAADAVTSASSGSLSRRLLSDNPLSKGLEQGFTWLDDTVTKWGLSADAAEVVSVAIVAVGVLLSCWLANWLAKWFIRGVVHRRILKSNRSWIHELAHHNVFLRLSHLVPVLLLAAALPAFDQYAVDDWLRPVLEIYVIWVAVAVTFGLIEVVESLVKHHDDREVVPTTGITQALKVVLALVAVVLSMSVVFDKSPLWFLSGLGAMAAVVMLIFKDSILGLVAGIQLSVNDMVRVGDWITIPSKAIDGDVEDLTLTTVRIRNFDATVSMVPAYDLVQNPFTNWRAMSESGGRRIKRSINIDTSTIRFVNREDLERFRKFSILADHLDEKIAEIDAWNASHDVDTSERINGRQQTNVGVFRAYINRYLSRRPDIHTEGFTFLVRHLDPTPQGLPIELYVFTNDNRWVPYEQIQADIFDHLLAAAGEFDLAVFQSPSGRDLRLLTART